MNVIYNRNENHKKSPLNDWEADWTNNDKVKEKVKTILSRSSITDSIINAFINSMPIRNSDSDAYIECFLSGLDEKYFNLYMVDKLIQKHLWHMIFKIFYKFKFEYHEEIAEKLMNAWYTWENIKIFKKEQ